MVESREEAIGIMQIAIAEQINPVYRKQDDTWSSTCPFCELGVYAYIEMHEIQHTATCAYTVATSFQ